MKINLTNQAIKTIAIAIPLGFMVFLAGSQFGQNKEIVLEQPNIDEKRLSTFGQHKKEYKFIDPLLSCKTVPKKEVGEFQVLKDKISQTIQSQITQGKATNVSVHFDTNDGRWLSINPEEIYSPASLAKLPVAIAFYKQAETKPEILKKTIVYDGSFDNNEGEYFKPTQVLKAGQAYTVEDLIIHMIKYSDNNAMQLLRDNMDKNSLKEIFGDLGVILPTENNEAVDFLTAKQYINFFQELYNATYLDRNKSEQLLKLLSEIDFPNGLLAGLPQGLVVAHKFGERSFPDNLADKNWRGIKELHDCGIIYYPEHPYLLCIMTKGNDFNDLAGVISSISKTVYEFKQERYKK